MKIKEKRNPLIINVITFESYDVIKTSGFEIGEEEDEGVFDSWEEN